VTPPTNRPLPGVRIMRTLGLEPDPWQAEVLEAGHPRLLLNCCRQAGKSTVVAILGLVEAMWAPASKVLLVSRSLRQSAELFRIVTGFYERLGSPAKVRQTAEELLLENHSRIVCLPCKEETIRGYSRVSLLVIDEAARVPDDLYRAVRPMLAVSNGRLICLSTPYGKRGFFHDAWANGGSDWARIEVPAEKISRIRPEFLAQENRSMGASWFRQEYGCSFEALEGLVYADFQSAVVGRQSAAQSAVGSGQSAGTGQLAVGRGQSAGNALPTADCRLPTGKRVGGIDFGFRNPFAAVWGVLDRGGVLWLTGEHYARQKPLSYHAQHLPRDVTWYADPSGATERCELRCAGFTVREGDNALRPGIAAVSARLENGTLRVLEGACPNLLAEAALYRYSDDAVEAPVDEHNHALAALRYLVSRLDTRHMAGSRADPEKPPPRKRRPWLRLDNEALWTPLW
jgi:hypothetical protein